VDKQGNVWIADFAGNKAGTKGHQVHKFSPKGEKLLSLGVAGKPGNTAGEFNQPNDVVVDVVQAPNDKQQIAPMPRSATHRRPRESNASACGVRNSP
jgi:hypothetical protein